VLAAVERLGGAALAAELRDWVHGHDDLPLAPALAAAGVQVGQEPPPGRPPWASSSAKAR
jgi:predicted metalloprotease with PDZ domain